jgi:catalase
MATPPENLTSNFGAPVPDDQNSLTAGNPGPVLMQDVHLLEKLAHFDRERIPERVVHAKGAGAYGYFEVTHDVSQYTRAKFLSAVGKRTEVFARFSTVGGERGSADAERDPRGFALKFYTEEGNYDMVGNNTPVFFIRDPLKFPDFIHTQKRNPVTNLKDPNMFWDFLSLTPESLHQVTILFSDRGTPRGHRHMHGFSSHTFMWYNAAGEYVWVKLHFITEQGAQNLTAAEADAMKSADPDHATRDLFQAIARQEFPAWRLEVQIMTPEQAADYHFDPFDVTKVWPHAEVPMRPVGRMVLDRNPQNYFNEVEQAAFSPADFVPGIAASPDKLLQGRLFSYHDTHLSRLGTNFHLLPVNAAHAAPVNNYQRDGAMNFGSGNHSAPNYYPNSFGGSEPVPAAAEPPFAVAGVAARQRYAHPNDDYTQPRALYCRVMSDTDRAHLISNIVGHLGHALPRLQLRQTALFYNVDPGYGLGVARGLGLSEDKVIALAQMTQEERVRATVE